MRRAAFVAFAWSTAGTAAMFATGALSLVVLSRLVTPAAFGFVAAVTAIATILRGLGPLSITQATIQDGDRPHRLERSANAAWVVSLLFAVAFLALAEPLASFFGFPDDAWLFRAWAPILLFQGAAVPAQAELQRELRFKELTVVQAVAAVSGTVVPIVLAVSGYDLGALYAAVLVQSIAELVGCSLALGRLVLPAKVGDTVGLLRRSTAFSMIFATSAAANQGDNIVVGSTLGSDALGYYSRAYRLMSFPANVFGDALDTVLYPVSLRSNDDLGLVYRGLVVANQLVALVLLPVSAVAAVLAVPFVDLVLGEQWGGAVPAFRILAAGMFFRVAQKLFGATLRGLGAQAQLARILAVYAGAVVALSLVGQRWGIEGVAVGVVIALVLNNVVSGVATMRRLGRPGWAAVTPILPAVPVAVVSGVLAFVVLHALDDAGSFVQVLAGGVAGAIPIAIAAMLPPQHSAIRSIVAMRHAPV